jgi:hypothetical protein
VDHWRNQSEDPLTHILNTAKGLAEKTPAERNRVVDLVRVASILIVVFGHWLMAAVMIENGEITAPHVLAEFPIARPLTWLLQVMPLFFFVGGYSNALSWRSARRRGESYAGWLRTRLRRLTLPVVPLLAVWGVLGWVALQAGFEGDLLRMASVVALGPTWFLAAYVLIVVLAPAALMFWERWGWWSIGFGLGLAAAIDVVSIGFGVAPIGFLNYIFVWATVHQLGYAWVDGKTEGSWIRPAMVISGFAAVLALVWFGPYPVEMVGFNSDGISNSLPPRLTLAFLGMFQAGLVLLFEPKLKQMMASVRAWTAVVLVSGQIMTLYLWHLTSMIILLGAGLALSGFGFGIEPFTGLWWLTRPVWLAALALVTALLVLVFGRFERPRPDVRPAPDAWRPVLAAAMICAGLGSLALGGIADDQGMNGLVLALPVIGMVLGGVMGATAFDRFSRA